MLYRGFLGLWVDLSSYDFIVAQTLVLLKIIFILVLSLPWDSIRSAYVLVNVLCIVCGKLLVQVMRQRR
jgi:hypothetical protein